LEKVIDMKELTIAILGAGEMATGIGHRLHSSNLTRIIMSEISNPISVRRRVAFSEAVYEGTMAVENVTAELIPDLSRVDSLWSERTIPVIVDDDGAFIRSIRPDIVVDATMTKKPKESLRGIVPFVIGVGPGFMAPDDVDVVVESNRGHDMGRVIYDGEAEPYTGTPGNISGFTDQRVLRSPCTGTARLIRAIGDRVKKGDTVLYVDDIPVVAGVDGIVRGLIRPIPVPKDEKIGDVDPRAIESHCWTISEKARAIAGGVLEAIMHKFCLFG
jgi:xanthine dehydrogenase accessory factor